MENKQQAGWDKFILLCQNARDEALFKELLDFFFTHEEKQHLVSRILLVRELLSKEKPQREISKDLHISIAKITRGSNALKQISIDLENYLKRELIE